MYSKNTDSEIKDLCGSLKIVNKEVIGTFYHVNLSFGDMERISKLVDIDTLAFYLSDISGDYLKPLSRNTYLSKLGFFSCKNIDDSAIYNIAKISNLEFISFLDTKVTDTGAKKLNELNKNLVVKFK